MRKELKAVLVFVFLAAVAVLWGAAPPSGNFVWHNFFTTNQNPRIIGTGGISVSSNAVAGTYTIDGSGVSGSGAITNVSDAGNAFLSWIYTSNNFTILLKTISAGANLWITNNGTNIVIAGPSTNGFVTQTITNGLATISYVNGATQGLVTASVTNGLATISYVDTSVNGASNVLRTLTVNSTNTLYAQTTGDLNAESNSLLTQINGSLANKVDELNGVATNLTMFRTNIIRDASRATLVFTNDGAISYSIIADSLGLSFYDQNNGYVALSLRNDGTGVSINPDNSGANSQFSMSGIQVFFASDTGALADRALILNSDNEFRHISIQGVLTSYWLDMTDTSIVSGVMFSNAVGMSLSGDVTNHQLTASKLMRTTATKKWVSSAYDDTDIINIATNNVRVAPGPGTTITTNYENGGVTYVVSDSEVASTMVKTNFVLNQVYTNTSVQPVLIKADTFMITAAVSGDCAVDLMYSPQGATSYALLSRVAIATTVAGGLALPITNTIVGVVTNLGSYYFTNTSSGIGNTAGLVGAGTGQYVIIGGGAQGPTGAAGASGSNGTSGITNFQFGVNIDGAGAPIATGLKNSFIYIDKPTTLHQWFIVTDVASTVTVDVYKTNFTQGVNGFRPSGSGLTICGGNKPSTTSLFSSNNALTSWTVTTLVSNDVLFFNVDSATSATYAKIWLQATSP